MLVSTAKTSGDICGMWVFWGDKTLMVSWSLGRTMRLPSPIAISAYLVHNIASTINGSYEPPGVSSRRIRAIYKGMIDKAGFASNVASSIQRCMCIQVSGLSKNSNIIQCMNSTVESTAMSCSLMNPHWQLWTRCLISRCRPQRLRNHPSACVHIIYCLPRRELKSSALLQLQIGII